jgi:hypothetical protein
MMVKFYDGIPINLAFEIDDDTNQEEIQVDYSKQFDTTYFSGAKNIEDQWHKEEFEYLSPLHINPDNIPDGFIILRADEPSVYDQNNGYFVSLLNKDNFRSEIIDKWKCVNYFDLSYQSNIGYWLYTNFVDNEQLPLNSFSLNIESNRDTTCIWNGIDFDSGVYTSKYESTVEQFYWEQPHFKMEKFITDGFKRNNLVYPHLLNIKYLFDDTPADPFELKKYSLNRYYGFYIDNLEWIMDITSYNIPQLISNIKIENNIFLSNDQITGSTCPFESWIDTNRYFIYAFNTLHEVKKIKQSNIDYYKIITDKNININDINYNGIVNINFINSGNTYENLIKNKNNIPLNIDPYYDKNGYWKGLYGDLYLIDIDNKYHILKWREKADFNPVGDIISSANISNINDTYLDDKYIYLATNSNMLIYDFNNNLIFSSAITSYSIYVNDLTKDIYVGTNYGILKRKNDGFISFINTSNSNIPGDTINKVYYKENKLFAGISGSTNYWWCGVISENSGITDRTYMSNYLVQAGPIIFSGTSEVSGFDFENDNIYISFANRVRKIYNYDVNNYIDFYKNNNSTFPVS